MTEQTLFDVFVIEPAGFTAEGMVTGYRATRCRSGLCHISAERVSRVETKHASEMGRDEVYQHVPAGTVPHIPTLPA